MTSTRARRRPAPPTGRRPSPSPARAWAAAGAAAAVAFVVVLVAVTRSGTPSPSSAGAELAHVHGLGINPADGALYAATHHGVFRVPRSGRAERVGRLVQDTMGFTVAGPDHFLASGHPDIDDRTLRRPGSPPLLGLVESTDGGRSWQSVSLLGEADFHSLVAAHGHVYGYDATGGRFMVSPDSTRWETRSRPAIGDFAVNPADADHVVAATDGGLAESADGGRRFQPVEGPQLAFLSWSGGQGLWGVSPAGETYRRTDGRWEAREALPGEPQALLATDDELYAAVSSGAATAIYVSSDGARTWNRLHSDAEAEP